MFQPPATDALRPATGCGIAQRRTAFVPGLKAAVSPTTKWRLSDAKHSADASATCGARSTRRTIGTTNRFKFDCRHDSATQSAGQRNGFDIAPLQLDAPANSQCEHTHRVAGPSRECHLDVRIGRDSFLRVAAVAIGRDENIKRGCGRFSERM
jgi:hypothetical protein